MGCNRYFDWRGHRSVAALVHCHRESKLEDAHNCLEGETNLLLY